MKRFSYLGIIALSFTANALLSGCSTTGGLPSTGKADLSAAAQSKTPPGMNEKGEVVDSSLVESGHGQKVTGLKDIEGEITGKPAANSKFMKLKIGMSIKQVTDLVGEPTDSGSRLTAKVFIPFYFGSDTIRTEGVYKGQGRLIFAAGGLISDAGGYNLIWIIHNAKEGGYR